MFWAFFDLHGVWPISSNSQVLQCNVPDQRKLVLRPSVGLERTQLFRLRKPEPLRLCEYPTMHSYRGRREVIAECQGLFSDRQIR
jgi:hypothetical protein